MTAEQTDVNAHAEAPSTFTPETPATGRDKEQLVLVIYIREESFTGKSSSCFEEDPRKSAAAAMAAKRAASTSSAQMLSYVHAALATHSRVFLLYRTHCSLHRTFIFLLVQALTDVFIYGVFLKVHPCTN